MHFVLLAYLHTDIFEYAVQEAEDRVSPLARHPGLLVPPLLAAVPARHFSPGNSACPCSVITGRPCSSAYIKVRSVWWSSLCLAACTRSVVSMQHGEAELRALSLSVDGADTRAGGARKQRVAGWSAGSRVCFLTIVLRYGRKPCL